ncbi:MAG: RHS repeat-associated core domain-containing protein [Acidobacteriaceae bacterium]
MIESRADTACYGNRWNQSGGTLTYGATFHNSQNRVDGATYDASGNLTQDPPGNPVRHSYIYDAENRLSGITDLGIAYTYDAEGKRIGVYTGGTLSKSFLRDQDQSSFMVFDHAGNLSSLNLFAAGRNIFQDTGGYWGYPIADALGTIKETTNDVYGWVMSICSNLPFGDGQNCENTNTLPFYFTGKERDYESGLDYFGARYYSSTMGRFMSPDWSGSPQAVPYSSLSDPQSLNLYGYVRNNPASTDDADGHKENTPGQPGGAPVTDGDPFTLHVTATGYTYERPNVYRVASLFFYGAAWRFGVLALESSPACVTGLGCAAPGTLAGLSALSALTGAAFQYYANQDAQPTPTTAPGNFEPVKGTPAKKNTQTGEIWEKDRLHKDHYEVYKNKKSFEKGNRDRSVWADGRPKQKF